MQRRYINLLEEEPQEPPVKKRWGALLTCLVILLLFFGGCIARGLVSQTPGDLSDYDPITLEPKTPSSLFQRIKHFVFSKDVTLEGQRRDRINILVLGQGGPGHDGPFLTDTIILLSIKPSTNQIALISIPRDLTVNIPGAGIQKINSANAFGESKESGRGPILTSKVIEETFDTDIDYYIRVDFKAFEEIIDTVGGVTVDVNRSFVDYEYPAPNGEYKTISFVKGVQTMNGKRALEFVRSRHGTNGEGSDFARSKRQQQVLLALKEKVLSFHTLINTEQIKKILNSLNTHIVTNMETGDKIGFVKLLRDLDTEHVIDFTLDNSPSGHLKNGISASGAFVLEPVDGNFDTINAIIEYIFDTPPALREDTTPTQEPPAIVEIETHIEIQNGTWQAGLAARIKKRLEDKRFTIDTLGNTTKRPTMDSGIYVLNDRPLGDVPTLLKDELHIPIKEILPQGEVATSTTDILIILGENFQE